LYIGSWLVERDAIGGFNMSTPETILINLKIINIIKSISNPIRACVILLLAVSSFSLLPPEFIQSIAALVSIAKKINIANINPMFINVDIKF
jgi:hypothetical protein